MSKMSDMYLSNLSNDMTSTEILSPSADADAKSKSGAAVWLQLPSQIWTGGLFLGLGLVVIVSYWFLVSQTRHKTNKLRTSNSGKNSGDSNNTSGNSNNNSGNSGNSKSPLGNKSIKITYDANKFWFGIEPSIQIVYYVMMVCAAAGFCAVTAWYCALPSLPQRGLFKHAAVMPVLFGIILAASAGWSFALALVPNMKWLVGTLLIVVAIGSILLVAGVMESEQRQWWSVLGAVAFAATTVLNDGVGWLSNYLVK